MKNGEPTLVRKKGSKPELAPRTALGLSADGRWLYALVVDGRQKGYSDGADMEDLIAVMKAAGASDAINMDGGGSSTLVFWDEEKKSAVIPNRHDAKRQSYRPVAINLGFYFEN
jgi:exopolysaccharide biosynthesis protein